MTLADLAALGNFVSGIAILVSLAYVAVQTRQAAKHSRALNAQQRTNRIIDILYRSSSSDLAGVIVKAEADPAALNEPQLLQYLSIEQSRFLNALDSFIQHRLGLLDDREFASFAQHNRRAMESASTRAAWRMLRGEFNPAFAAFMDGLAADSETQLRPSRLDEWRALTTSEPNRNRHDRGARDEGPRRPAGFAEAAEDVPREFESPKVRQ